MTVAASPVLGRPLWFELMTSDPKAAETSTRRSWAGTRPRSKSRREPYTMFQRSGEVPVGGVLDTPEG